VKRVVFFAVMAAFCLGLTPKAQANPQVLFGINDENFRSNWAQMSQQIAPLKNVAIGVWVPWKCGSLVQPEPKWQIPEDQHVLLQVYGKPWIGCSQYAATEAGRQSYCSFVRYLVDEHPGIDQVQIWNEPDLSMFWTGSPDDYVRLYSQCYQMLHPRVKVLFGGFSPNAITPNDSSSGPNVKAFLNAYEAFQEDHDWRAINMDCFAYHPYWGFGNKTTRLLIQMLDDAFRGTPLENTAQRVKLCWTESGMWSEPGPWAAKYRMGGSPNDQKRRVQAVLRLAYCNPRVTEVFNFLNSDEADRVGQGYGWKSGLFEYNGLPKPAFFEYKYVNDQRLTNGINCHRLRRAIKTAPKKE
jgi:hypothetical protein